MTFFCLRPPYGSSSCLLKFHEPIEILIRPGDKAVETGADIDESFHSASIFFWSAFLSVLVLASDNARPKCRLAVALSMPE